MYTNPDQAEQTDAQLREANACVLGAEAQARHLFERLFAKGGTQEQAVASVPIKDGDPARVFARYRGNAPTMFEVMPSAGHFLMIQFATRDAVVEFVKNRLFGEVA